MKHHFLLLYFIILSIHIHAQAVQYMPVDSIRIEDWLKQAAKQNKQQNMILYFARMLKDIPYVAKTLEVNDTEQLIVNTRQLDCTTYVENVLALNLCHKNKQTRFASFCRYLRHIRYHKGKVSYANRLHYFSEWIADNEQKGYVKSIAPHHAPFTATQIVDLHFMSSHPNLYPMMRNNLKVINAIKELEQKVSGKKYLYIPKDSIQNTQLMRNAIHDGDILAMLTKKKGLDTSHIGIAVWHNDGLHLLNASSIHGRVVEEDKTLYQYMQTQRTQIGIRVIRCK